MQTFFAALLGEVCVLILFYLNETEVIQLAYLWLNLIGCALVIFFATVIQGLSRNNKELVV